MPGPLPKHPSVRARARDGRRAKADFRSLPAAGFTGQTPPWPLTPDLRSQAAYERGRDVIARLQAELAEVTDGRRRGRIRRELDKYELEVAVLGLQLEQSADAEVAMWSDLWRSPQATIWAESSATHHDLALYVRWSIRAEQGDMKAASEARQLSDRHGINPVALLRLRAEVEHADEAEERGRRRRSSNSTTSRSPRGRKPPDDPRSGLRSVS